MKLISIKKLKKLEGKIVFLRVDFNVSIKNGELRDDFKLRSAIPTINYLREHGARIIVATHLGRPEGRDLRYSTRPIAKYLEPMLGAKVAFVADCIGKKVVSAVNGLKNGDVAMLENLRFYEEEDENDSAFAKKLIAVADIYVNNAFAVCHRANASVSAIRKFTTPYMGFLLEDELRNLARALKPKKPLCVIIGGVKIDTKAPLISNFSKISGDVHILIGSALAGVFLSLDSRFRNKFDYGTELRSLAKKLYSKKIVLPIDFIVSDKKIKLVNVGKLDRNNIKHRHIDDLRHDDMILDIGPETVRLFGTYLKVSHTIVWNGPLGMYEYQPFRHGTTGIALLVGSYAKGRAFAVVGGGETEEALEMTKMYEHIDWVSTGGGAMLAYLGGEKMPGLEAVKK